MWTWLSFTQRLVYTTLPVQGDSWLGANAQFSPNWATLYGGKGGFNSLNTNNNETKYKINKDGSFVICEGFLTHFLQSKEHTPMVFLFLTEGSARYRKHDMANELSYILLDVKAIFKNICK